MNYELAKELKDAGFPNSRAWLDNGAGYWVDKGEFVYEVPTLSELIEACGDNILGLHRTHGPDNNPNGWFADTHTHACDCGKTECQGFNWEHEEGATPEEAVARLWLALNRKEV